MKLDGDRSIDSLFPVHVFTPEERNEVLLNNIVIDWYYGHRDILERIQTPVCATELVQELKSISNEELERRFQNAKRKSLLMTAMFLTGECDANCDICYTDRRQKDDELDWDEIREIIRQVHTLGNKTIYIPGEGEPFLDRSIFDLIELAKKLKQNVVIFTNGLLISDEEHFKRRWGFPLARFFEIIKESPVYFYVKYWHSDKVKFAEMMRIPPQQLNTEKVVLQNGHKVDVPEALLNLIRVAPEKAGIETAVHSLNFEDIFENIMPLVNEYGIKWYLEPILHAGRYFGRHDYDLNLEQYLKVFPILSKQQCERTGFSTVITATGLLSYCPSFLTHLTIKDCQALQDLSIREGGQKGKIKDIFSILHKNKFLVKTRYAAYAHKCLCEYISSKMENKENWLDIEKSLIM